MEGSRGGSLASSPLGLPPSGGDLFGLGVVDFGGGLAFVRGVRSVFVIKPQVSSEMGVGLDHRLIALQVDFLVFAAAPQAFDKDVVQASAFAIHRQFYARGQQGLGKLRAGELAALVGIEDLRDAVLGHRPLDRTHTERGVQGVGQFPRQHAAAVPVEHRTQVKETAAHRNGGDVGGPNLIGEIHAQMPQQIRVNRMPGGSLREAGLGADRYQSHLQHQPSHAFAVHYMTRATQPTGHLPTAKERVRQVGLVNHAPHREVAFAHRTGAEKGGKDLLLR